MAGRIVQVLVGAGLLGVMGCATGSERVTVPGQEVPLRDKAQHIGAIDPATALTISISMAPRDPAGLDRLVSDLYDSQSPLFHKFITPAEYKARFGATDAQVQKVVGWLESQDIHVNSIAPNNMIIKGEATVSLAQQAFGVTMSQYLLRDGRVAYANDTSPAVPADIAPLVQSIRGLDNTGRVHPFYQLSPRSHSGGGGSGGCTGSYASSDGYLPSDLEGAYGISSLSLTGEGETIAVVEFDAFPTGDPACYFTGAGITTPPTITVVPVNGGVSTPGSGAIEVDLDIDILGGIAPGATILVYEDSTNDFPGDDLYNQIVSDNKATVVSASWGECEGELGSSAVQSLDAIFKAGAAQGIAFFAAAGDDGAYDCGDGSGLEVDSPGGDPYVTAVGGTTLTTSGGTYGGEDVWGNNSGSGDCGQAANDPGTQNPGAGGGGFSQFFTLPTWQTGPGVTSASCTNPNSGAGGREVPDVSANADPNTGDAFYCSVSSAQCSGWGGVGGTSAAAPTWAASMALVNQYLKAAGKSPVGNANPALYAIFNAQGGAGFHDVTTGDNLYYPATAGYDMGSGIGSPNLAVLAPEFAGVTVPGATPTPSAQPTPSSQPTSTPGGDGATGSGTKTGGCDVASTDMGAGVWMAAALALVLAAMSRRQAAR